MTAYLVRMRSGCEGGGKGALVQTEKSGTLATNNDQTLFVIENKCYRISSDASNSMRSKNPHSGIYETELSPTIDTTVPNPSKGQGGLCVVAIAGNTIGRKPMNGGNGNGFETDGKMYTLTATDVHAVCYENNEPEERIEEKVLAFKAQQGSGARTLACSEKVSPTLWSSPCGFPSPAVCIVKPKIFENHAQDARYEEKETCPTITSRYGTGGGNVPLTFGKVSRPKGKDGLGERWSEVKIASTRNCMDIGDSRAQEAVVMHSQVRRLTPVECERLMGFPDGYTDFKEKTPDGPRYKALGNSWAVPVVKWIGKRIDDYLEGRLK